MPPSNATYARVPERRSPNRSTLPGRQRVATPDRRCTSIDAGLQIGARNRHARLLLDAQLRTSQRDLERCGIVAISNQQVRHAMRDEIHRTTDGHCARLLSPTAAILDRREESRPT